MNSKEINRLNEVKKFLEVDFTNIIEFKQITDLASKLCEMPISLITLLDRDTNWIKVSTGIEVSQAPRETSFCQFAIQEDHLFIIPDAKSDIRFVDNPIVDKAPNFRFYAGAPLILSNGYKIGTLCLFDVKPNQLNEVQQLALITLSRQVVYLMELKISQNLLQLQLKEIENKNRSLRQIAQFQSHEIRQPLTSIIGLVKLVSQGLHEVDEEWLSMITDATSILDTKIHAIVNESMGNNDVKLVQFNKVVEEIEDYAIILLDRSGKIENWNKGSEKIKGYSSSEIVGKHFSKFYTAEDQQANLPNRLLEEAVRNDVTRNTGWRERKDGTLFWASVVITSIHNDSQEVIGFIKVTRDLSELITAQNSLDNSELRSSRMIDEIEDYAIILLDMDGHIEKWNKGAQKIKQYSSEEVMGKSFNIFYTKEDIEKAAPLKFLEQARMEGRANQEGWRLRKDKTKFWGSVVLTAIHDPAGEVIGFVKITKELVSN